MCLNLQTHLACSSEFAFTNGTYSINNSDGDGSETPDFITITGGVVALFAANIAWAIVSNCGKKLYQNREQIGEFFGSCTASACSTIARKLGLYEEEEEEDPIGDVIPSNLPTDLANGLRAIHKTLVATDGIETVQEDDGDLYYEVYKSSAEEDNELLRTYAIMRIENLPGAKELFENDIPDDKILNPGGDESGKIFKSLNPKEFYGLIGQFSYKHKDLETQLKGGLEGWRSSHILRIIQQGNVDNIFIGNYEDRSDGKFDFVAKLLFRIVNGREPTSQIFTETGELNFELTWNKKKKELFSELEEEEESTRKHKHKKKRYKKQKKKHHKKLNGSEDFDIENYGARHFHSYKKCWVHPDCMGSSGYYGEIVELPAPETSYPSRVVIRSSVGDRTTESILTDESD